MLDCYNVKDEILMDKMRIKELFTELIKINNMTPISDFVVYDVDEDSNSKRDFGGLTGFQIIKESHISIHTFKWIWFVTLDIYTCKKLNKEGSINLVKKYLETNDIEVNFLIRWTKYWEFLYKFLNSKV